MKRLEMIPVEESNASEKSKMVTLNVTQAVTQMYANVLKLKLKFLKLKLVRDLLKSPLRAPKLENKLPSRKKRFTRLTRGRLGVEQP